MHAFWVYHIEIKLEGQRESQQQNKSHVLAVMSHEQAAKSNVYMS